MSGLAALGEAPVKAHKFASQGDLTGFFMQLCAEIGADCYMLVSLTNGQDKPELNILASNWIYDAIRLIGRDFMANLAESRLSAPPGRRASALVCAQAPEMLDLVTGEQARLLDVLGHAEIFTLKLHVGKRRFHVLFSSEEAGSIDVEALPRAQMLSCYALSASPEMLTAVTMQNPLSERERECLQWVSVGKTTDEMAMILGVSSNTVNSYVTHAIQKFGAKNRAMAVATAVRNGII